MKKIGILTFHKENNFGAILQAYALQRALSDKGYKNEFINYRSNYMSKLFLKEKIKNKGYFLFLLSCLSRLMLNLKQKKFNYFRKKLQISKIYDLETIKETNNEYSCFIAGSDQIWNYKITNLDPTYFLNFVKDKKKRINYAASFGTSNIPKKLYDDYKDLLNNFFDFNLREQSGQQFLKKLINQNSNHVLDPVFLISKNEWVKLLKKNNSNEKYILVIQGSLSNKLLKHAKELKKIMKIKIIYIPFPFGFDISNLSILLNISPERWLSYIYNAEIVITDSFHATAFSIIFNKNFYIVLTTNTSRITDLLKLLNINDRILSSNIKNNYNYKLNWNDINSEINRYSKKSISNLIKNINKSLN